MAGVGESRQRTLEQAKEAGVAGWNICCQMCGTFGALWWPSLVRRSANVRLCDECKDQQAVAYMVLSDAERARFRADGSEDPRQRVGG